MQCFYPIKGFRRIGGGFTFIKNESASIKMEVPCGQCLGCRLRRSQEWATRMVHEAQMHEENSFITLTYAEEPADKSINVEHFQKFMKRLRKHYNGKKIRFFHCGEYGKVYQADGLTPSPHPISDGREALGRAHYHAILFGLDFKDKELLKVDKGNKHYKSETLRKLWGHGHVVVGDVTRESAAYVARYVMKKVNGEMAEDYYKKVGEDGEVFPVKPEYTTMSRRPGIGESWYRKYKNDLFPHDECIVQGKKVPVPQYYLKKLKEEQPHTHEVIKEKRYKKAMKRKLDNTPERLKVKETCLQAKVYKLKRGLK